VCVCVYAWLGAFGVSTGEKKHFNECERMQGGKLIWCVSLFQGSG